MRKSIPTAAAAEPEQAANEAGVPMKLSKLQLALNKANASVERVQQMESDIEELERTAGPKIVFAVATKEGYRLADDARATARKLRLDIKGMRDDGTKLLNTLKNEFWGVTDPAMERLQAIEDNAKAQRDAQDAKEAARKQRHEANIKAIEQLAADNLGQAGSVNILQRIATLEAIVVDDSYEEYERRAAQAAEDTMKALRFALAAAERREEEARELAERRAREERQRAIRQRIADIKATADGCEGTGLENVEAVIRSMEAAPPQAADFDDMLEFAELAHDKALRELRNLADSLRAEAIADAKRPPSASEQAAADVRIFNDPAPDAPDDIPPADGWKQTFPRDRQLVPSIPLAEEEDPFAMPMRRVVIDNDSRRGGEPQRIALTVPATAPRAAAPRPAAARPSAADAQNRAMRERLEQLPMARVAPVNPVPGLRASAELVIAAFDKLPRNVTVEWEWNDESPPDAASLTFTRAIQFLRDALAHNE